MPFAIALSGAENTVHDPVLKQLDRIKPDEVSRDYNWLTNSGSNYPHTISVIPQNDLVYLLVHNPTLGVAVTRSGR